MKQARDRPGPAWALAGAALAFACGSAHPPPTAPPVAPQAVPAPTASSPASTASSLPANTDRDNDGVPDAEDQCPDEPGRRTPGLHGSGCPHLLTTP